MIKYIAIDDEPLALRQIRSYADRIPDLEEAASCSSAAVLTSATKLGDLCMARAMASL